MFDTGSEITLVSSIFAKKKNLPFEQATYTLAGIGSNATTYKNGKIYAVPLVDSNGEVILVKAFSVNTILTEKIGRDEVVFKNEDFPHLSKAVLEKAAKPLNKKYLDILMENPNLGLQPVCETGFGCHHSPQTCHSNKNLATYSRTLLPGRSIRSLTSGKMSSL